MNANSSLYSYIKKKKFLLIILIIIIIVSVLLIVFYRDLIRKAITGFIAPLEVPSQIGVTEIEMISSVSSGARNKYVIIPSGANFIVPLSGRENKYNTPGEVWFSLPVKTGDVITQIGVLGPIPSANDHYKKATLIEKHPGWFGITEITGANVQQNENDPAIKWSSVFSYTVPQDRMVFVRADLYSSTDHANNKFTGIVYKIQKAPAPAEETRYIGAIHPGSYFKAILTGSRYAYMVPYTTNHKAELWFSLPVKTGDVITELGISGPIPTTGTQYKKATIIEKHPGWSGGIEYDETATEKRYVKQNQGDYYIKWGKASETFSDYTVPENRGVLVRVDLFSTQWYGNNTFTGLWYKVRPAAESGQTRFISPMHSGSKQTYSSQEGNLVTQFGNGYVYIYPVTATSGGVLWLQLPVGAGDIITDIGVSSLLSGTGTAYAKASVFEFDPVSDVLIEKANIQQNLGDYYVKWIDITDYTAPSGKMVLVKVELYAGTGTNNSFTGFWLKKKILISKPKISIFLLNNVKTCIVGDACVNNCKNIARLDGSIYTSFEINDNYKSLTPSDPTLNSYAQKVCFNLNLDTNTNIIYANKNTVINNINKLREDVLSASQNRIDPSIDFIEIENVEIAMAKSWDSFWLPPWDINNFVRNYVSNKVDNIFVVHASYDLSSDIWFPGAACDLTYGADFGIGGAGYSWIPCIDIANVYFHAWIHQVDWALYHIMGISDVYDNDASKYHSCRNSPYLSFSWFPNADDCLTDPDSPYCGFSDCTPYLDEWNKHVISEHYNFEYEFIGNHCRDGKQDFGETGVDVGGNC